MNENCLLTWFLQKHSRLPHCVSGYIIYYGGFLLPFPFELGMQEKKNVNDFFFSHKQTTESI